jgi:hypothetical protein
LAEGDRVLVKDQTTLTENGIYDVSTGEWTRSLDFDGNGDVVNGTLIYITSGSVNIKRLYATSVSNPVTIGSSNIEFIFAIAFGDEQLLASNNLSDVPNKATARDNLGLEIGVDIPSYFDVSKYASGNFYIDSSVVANTYILTKVASLVNPVNGSNDYYNGMIIKFRPNYNNTGSSTANVNGRGAITLKEKDGTTNLSADFLQTTKDYEFVYWDGIFRNTNFEIEDATTTTKGVSLLPQPITIANNSTDSEHDIDFSAGNAQADDGSVVFRVGALTKQIDAVWAAGTNQGGLDTGTVANDTTYHCYAIYNPTTLASDFILTATYGSPTMPSGYTKKKWVMAVLTDGSANIIPFKQDGKFIQGGLQCYNSTVVPASYTDLTIQGIPTGIRVAVNLDIFFLDNAGNSIDFRDKETLFEYTPISASANVTYRNRITMYTNTSAEIEHKGSATPATTYIIQSQGWFIPDELY